MGSKNKAALKLISEFAAKSGGGTFPHITRNQVTSGLKARVITPRLIDQGKASLCGPAALVYAVLRKNPVHYVRYVTGLYDDGAALLGDDPGIWVKPSEDCRNFDPAGKVKTVDWIALASLCDSENDGWDYDDSSDEVAGVTLPVTLGRWLKKCDFGNRRVEVNYAFTKDKDSLKFASDLHRQGHRVCLFCKGATFYGEQGFFAVPSHWATMTKPATFSGDDISLQVQSWGDHFDLDVPLSTFLSTYFGFVSGRP